METLKKRLSLRDHQIKDIRSQISSIQQDSYKINQVLSTSQAEISDLEQQIQSIDDMLKSELLEKEKNLQRLQDLESYMEEPDPPIKSEDEKPKDVATAYIEFYTRMVQSKPMFKKLPEFQEEIRPASPPKLNDVELDEELEKLGLSDVLKKYS